MLEVADIFRAHGAAWRKANAGQARVWLSSREADLLPVAYFHVVFTLPAAIAKPRIILRYELTVHEWAAIKPFLPTKSRGVPLVNDGRVLNGIFWVLRSGAPWRNRVHYLYNRFVRWRRGASGAGL